MRVAVQMVSRPKSGVFPGLSYGHVTAGFGHTAAEVRRGHQVAVTNWFTDVMHNVLPICLRYQIVSL